MLKLYQVDLHSYLLICIEVFTDILGLVGMGGGGLGVLKYSYFTFSKLAYNYFL